MTARSFLGAGRVLADVFVGGSPSGKYIEFQEVGKFSIKANSELKNQTSKDRVRYGQTLETVAIIQPGEFSMTLREVNRESLRMAFMADAETIATGSATVADADFVAALGSFKAVAGGHQNLAEAGFELTNAAGTVTYVLGTDYDVNYRFGLVRALVGGAIADEANLKVSYTANARSGSRLLGNRRASLRAKLLFDGINLVDDSPALVTVWEALLTPTSEVDLMSDDWVEVELAGSLKTPTGKDQPFEVELLDD